MFRMPKRVPRAILDEKIVDEMIYNTKDRRNRLIFPAKLFPLSSPYGLGEISVFPFYAVLPGG
jgi:hypothetical protein